MLKSFDNFENLHLAINHRDEGPAPLCEREMLNPSCWSHFLIHPSIFAVREGEPRQGMSLHPPSRHDADQLQDPNWHLNSSSAASCAQSKSGPFCNPLGSHSLKGRKQGRKHRAKKWPPRESQCHKVPWDLGSCKLTFGATCGKGSFNTVCAYSTNCK